MKRPKPVFNSSTNPLGTSRSQKGLMALSVRTIGIARAEAKIGMVNLAYNMRRFLWLEGRDAPA